MNQLIRFASVIIAFCVSTSALAGTAVIVNPANGDSLDEQTIKRIFLGKSKAFANGNKIETVIATEEDAAYQVLAAKVLGKQTAQLKAYWAKMTFTGKGVPPKSLGSAAEAKAFVAANPNAISVIDESQVDGSVKAVLTF